MCDTRPGTTYGAYLIPDMILDMIPDLVPDPYTVNELISEASRRTYWGVWGGGRPPMEKIIIRHLPGPGQYQARPQGPTGPAWSV